MRFVTECTREVGRCPANGAIYVIAKAEDPDGDVCWQWFAYAPQSGAGTLESIGSGVSYGSLSRNLAKAKAIDVIKTWAKGQPR